MPHTRISHRGTSRRILSALLAIVAAFAMLAFVVAPPAQAHVRSVTTDCYGWSVSLSVYDEGGSVEIWVDGAVVTDIPDFGSDFSETGTWDPTEDHTLRVRVLAFDDLDGARGLSFDETYTSESCETSPTLKLVKAVVGGTAVADDWTLSASAAAPNAARNFSNAGGSGTFNSVFGGVAYSLAESGPVSYAAGAWSCSVNESAAVPGSSITLSNGQSAVCTITNTYTPPSIDIVKDATPTYYGEDGVGTFTITVHNDGPVPLTDVSVTDDVADAIDPSSDCARPIKDLAVDEKVTYSCTVGNLDFAGLAPFENSATAIGKGPDGTQVTDTDTATVFPQVLNTTVTTAAPTTTTTAAPATTAAPTTTSATSETLPVTGVAGEQLRGFGIAGLALVLAGIVLLGGATLIGQYRRND
ncbi:MAG: hypothetical protein WBN35_01770 [Acidimicrobiia bacterium]